MRRLGFAVLAAASFGGHALAQEPYTGPASFGAQETLFRYDDQEPWKHGWKKQMNYHEGFHSFRPYNYHHVFGQTQAAAAWGQTMPYSQQWWHRYYSVSAQYNHLQGQPPMAMPQYNGPAVPPATAPANTQPAPGPIIMGPTSGMPQQNAYVQPQGTYFPEGMMVPPSTMPPSAIYEQPAAPINIPSMPAPLMPVN